MGVGDLSVLTTVGPESVLRPLRNDSAFPYKTKLFGAHRTPFHFETMEHPHFDICVIILSTKFCHGYTSK